ncbi:MAG: hypothetical protein ISS45_08645 [Candidatus Omnitrophica bacterium]|nr:hypothetical protein [Candidatus Omnitrophota bacterium]
MFVQPQGSIISKYFYPPTQKTTGFARACTPKWRYGTQAWMSATKIGGSAKFYGGNAKKELLRRMFAERAKP